jgi:phage terminase large subunit-like protein
MRGDTLPNDWRKWVKANPNMDITGADETVGNPTGLVLTEGS